MGTKGQKNPGASRHQSLILRKKRKATLLRGDWTLPHPALTIHNSNICMCAYIQCTHVPHCLCRWHMYDTYAYTRTQTCLCRHTHVWRQTRCLSEPQRRAKQKTGAKITNSEEKPHCVPMNVRAPCVQAFCVCLCGHFMSFSQEVNTCVGARRYAHLYVVHVNSADTCDHRRRHVWTGLNPASWFGPTDNIGKQFCLISVQIAQ